MFAMPDALRVIDTRMAGKQISGHATDCGKRADARTEQLHSHNRGGDRRVCGPREHRNEANGCHQRERHMQQRRQCITEGRTDVKQWCDLATLKACSKRCNVKPNLARKSHGCIGC